MKSSGERPVESSTHVVPVATVIQVGTDMRTEEAWGKEAVALAPSTPTVASLMGRDTSKKFPACSLDASPYREEKECKKNSWC